jgi:hypothetical protein
MKRVELCPEEDRHCEHEIVPTLYRATQIQSAGVETLVVLRPIGAFTRLYNMICAI